nr:hypothetical protein [Tanacetum cinerariifolium]
MSYASGSGDGFDTHSKVLDEQQQKVSGINKGAGVRPKVPDVPKYDSESNEESWKFSQDEDDVDEETDLNDDSEETKSDNDGDDLTHPKLSTYKEQDEEDDLYKDVNINLERSDVEMTNAQANQDTEDTHCETLVNVLVSIAAKIPSSDTTIPQPPILNIQPLQQTPGSTTTTTIPTMTIPDIPYFESLFQFDQKVFALENKMSEFKQTSQFADVVSSILGIVDNYLAFKMKDVVDVAAQLQTNKLREKAKAKNQEFLNQVDLTMKTITKKQVQAQVFKIMPKIEKYVTYSLEAKVLRGRDDQGKDEDLSAGLNRGSNRRRSGKEAESSKERCIRSPSPQALQKVLVPTATTAAASTLTAAPSRRTKGVVIRDLEESTTTTSTIIHIEAKSKDKGKGILVEEPKPFKKQAQIKQDEQYARELEAELNINIDWGEVIDHVKNKAKEDPAVKRYQALNRKPQTEAQTRKNMMIYLTKEHIDEEESRALKKINETPAEKAAKRKKLDEEVEELKRHLQLVPNEEDDVYTKATPLAHKFPAIDYEIINQNNKPYYKIIRADERKYPLTRFTLDQMLNVVRLKVEEESEVSLELLSFGVDAAKEFKEKHAKCLMLLVKDLVLSSQDDDVN